MRFCKIDVASIDIREEPRLIPKEWSLAQPGPDNEGVAGPRFDLAYLGFPGIR